jgi:hypothetical protein
MRIIVLVLVKSQRNAAKCALQDCRLFALIHPINYDFECLLIIAQGIL